MRARTTLILLLAAPAFADPVITTEFGIEFVTVGDPGNRDTRPDETPFHLGKPFGGVAYEYRMARTEITVGQWFEFVDAYLDANPGISTSTTSLTGPDLNIILGAIEVRPGRDLERPTRMGWEYAARYANWLHNGKAEEAWAFESGAYDTSTFTEDPDGFFNHQAERSPGARFWIPSQSEWLKAAHWDPNKDGEGGYWLFPNGTGEDLLPGRPEDGGERNAGAPSDGFPLPVGSYPDVQSPWGVLDLAGGVTEWIESQVVDGGSTRINEGSRVTPKFGDPFSFDRLDSSGLSLMSFGSGAGLRLASVVPAPGGLALAAVTFTLTRRRR